MIIQIETNDREELKNAINNGLFLLGRELKALYFGLEDDIPSDLIKLLDSKFGNDCQAKLNFMQNRFDLLKQLYEQL